MWILGKLFITLVSFLGPFLEKKLEKFFVTEGSSEGRTLYYRVSRNKSRKVIRTEIGIPFPTRSLFRITQESHFDKFFKALGLAEEFQSGDPEFDDRFYLASDCRDFRRKIWKDAEVRKAIETLFNRGFTRISCNGKTLWFRIPGDHKDNWVHAQQCFKVADLLKELTQNLRSDFKDPYIVHVMLLEAFVWALVGYATMGIMEWLIYHETLHLDPIWIVVKGMIGGLILMGLFLGALAIFLKGSSRGHRVLVESSIALLFALPVGGIMLASDLNTQLDKSEPFTVQSRVDQLQIYISSGRSRTTYYYVYQTPLTNTRNFEIPRRLKVTKDLYYELKEGQVIELELGAGNLNIPWLRAITPLAQSAK